MGRKCKEWTDCKDQRDWLRTAKANGLPVEHGGRHTCIVANGRRIPIPNGETKTGTRGSILRSLSAAGVVVLLILSLATFAALYSLAV